MSVHDSSLEKNTELLGSAAANDQCDQLKKIAAIGWFIFPVYGISAGKCQCGNPSCGSIGKHPIPLTGMNSASCDEVQIDSWFSQYPNCNWAVNCKLSGLVCIDVDPRSGGDTSLANLENLIEDSLPFTVSVLSGQSKNHEGAYVRGSHYYFADDGRKWPSNLSRYGFPGIDIKTNGYVLIPHSLHKSGFFYEWKKNASLFEIKVVDVPKPLVSIVFPDKVAGLKEIESTKKAYENFHVSYKKEAIDLEKFFRTELREGERSNQILSAACAMARREGTDEGAKARIIDRFKKFNAECVKPPLEESELIQTLYNAMNWIEKKKKSEEVSLHLDVSGSMATPKFLTFPFTDQTTEGELADWLGSKCFTGVLVWSESRGWMHYEHGVWHHTPVEFVGDMVRILFREISLDLHTKQGASAATHRAMRFETHNKIMAVVSLMKGVCGVRDDIFDKHKDFLNVKNGVVDLSTGELQDHSPYFYFTKQTPAKYVYGAAHSDWEMALRCLPIELAHYVQLRMGQGITGNVPKDDKIFFFIGSGENGKTTLLSGVSTALGEYFTFVPHKVLMGNKNDHTTELMTLMGTRLTVIEELPEGAELPIEQLKRITGVQKLTARKIGQDNQEFACSHSLIVTTNTLPMVSRSDHGTWRRFVVVEFPFRFSADVTRDDEYVKVGDINLRSRLEANDSGQSEAILAWLVEGAVEMAKLNGKFPRPPQAAIESLGKWRKQSDYIFDFLMDNYVLDPSGFVRSADLYETYRRVTCRHDTDKAIATKLKSHGFLDSNGVHNVKRVVKYLGITERVMGWEGIRSKL